MTSIDEPVNQTLTRSSELLKALGPPPWTQLVIDDGRNRVGISASEPGQVVMADDLHIHPDFNELWIVLAGEIEFEIGQYPPVRAGAGDIVMSPVGMVHMWTSVGDEPSLRAFVSKLDSDHSMQRGGAGAGQDAPPTRDLPSQPHPH